jgi:spore maturation protein CgeB
MTGGFLLTEACSETENYFVPGKHLDTYREEGELLEKARWYLGHPAERKAMAEAGRAHALANHTWKHRFQQLLQVLGISN